METHRQPLIGSSEILHLVLEQVSQVAPLNRPVLVIGERGTGKELIAERLHFLSRRWEQPYLQVNCAAMNENLLESELFGHEAGAYTGAVKNRAGLFERADGGTLFLDELATASLPIQEKLLRIIEYGRFERLGGNKTLQVDVRVIAATNEDLPSLARDNRFRSDLLDRLAFDVINIPPLRYRMEDIPELADHFAQKMCRELGHNWFAGFTAHAQKELMDYHWPGNVRELKNVVERSVYRNPEPEEPIGQIILDPFITPWRDTDTRLPASPVVKAEESSIPETLDLRGKIAEFERRLISETLQKNQFNQRRTAKALGLTYHQLRAAFRKYPDILKGENNE
ncbi:phage shock protein operon transcriptional activator [Hahella sp. CCB-MM4]|uniref:phage shock protein operon transcriptional activator n=1 Tax=Hahella sp. (strain CCB-MM4) TaxID=1926491 RepID=UPI000B9B9F44|nr:phage shock protein operon transcriptional activator [Hahella sp. CCB-MM4]OZG74522.1 phage shock protein operon transcriptional activator [Hahella sp. CCB-MM4]